MKFILEQTIKAKGGGSRGISLLFFFNLCTRWGGWSTPCLDCCTPGKETRYPLYRRLNRLQGQSGGMWKILTPTAGIQSLDCPACCEPPYQLHYPGLPAVFYAALKIVPSILVHVLADSCVCRRKGLGW